MYRLRGGRLEVLLGHPGGPYFRWADAGVWSLPKGLVEPGEGSGAAAYREFHEETGITVFKIMENWSRDKGTLGAY